MAQRLEQRFPCVGIELMFSPVRNQCIENLGAQIYSAIGHDMSFSGLSFDVVHPMNISDQLHILVSNQFQPTERLLTEVCWCKTLENGHYRIGVRIMASEGLAPTGEIIDENISVSDSIGPSEAKLVCPSCTKVATFNFVKNQEGDWGKGIMPLYQCDYCSTTRSIPNILEYNRRLRVSELKSCKTVFKQDPTDIKSDTILKRILYVEDEPDIQTVAQMALEMVGGYTVKVCSSGKEVLAKAPDFKPDLLLFDVMMPDLSGPQLLAQLRLQPQFATTPAIFMTAKVQTHEISEYKAPYVLGVIPKPFDPMTLSSEIASLFYRKTK
jgi:two-component system OmpR family response regulator